MSEILKECHDLAKGLHQIGAMTDEAFAKVEAVCTLTAAPFDAFKTAIEASGNVVPRMAHATEKSKSPLKDPSD